MMNYTQLAQEERYQICALMKAGRSQTEIRYLVEAPQLDNRPGAQVHPEIVRFLTPIWSSSCL